MAPSFLLSFLFSLSLAACAAARPSIHFNPCKTLFISYTFTSSETLDLTQIAAPRDPSSPSSGGYFAIYRAFHPLRSLSFSRSFAMPIRGFHSMTVQRAGAASEIVRSAPSFGISSLQEWVKDILLVVAGLLFGVGCGALTGAIIHLAWSLFINRYKICRSDNEEDENESPKKLGYIKIADPVPAKEGCEGH